MPFSASYDRITKIISALVCIFLLAVPVISEHLLVACLSLLIVGLAYAYSPRSYVVADRSILVKRIIGEVRVSLEGLREARRATADDLQGSIRLWGNGGLFGYYGLFRTSTLGKCWWYVTNRQNTVVVITNQKTALFSPDDVDGFLAAIRTVAPVAEGPGERLAAPAPSHAVRKSIGFWIGVVVAVLTVGVVAFAFLYSPGPPRYTLTPDALTVHDRFYPVTLKAFDVDVARIRVVDFRVDEEWRPTMRTNGFANQHYRAGWFRVANGRTVRMYRADGTRLVLLPPKGDGAPVLVEVTDPDRFVEEVRRKWGKAS
jgi:hypothetical protein